MCKFVRLVLFVISVSVCPSLLFASDSLSELCYGFERVRHNAVYSYKGGNVLKIIQVANNSGLILVTVRHSPFGITPKVFALQTNLEGLVDDGEVPVGYYAHEGPYQYQNALGARRTVDSFRMLSESERDAYVEQRNKDAERVRKEEEKIAIEQQPHRKKVAEEMLRSMHLEGANVLVEKVLAPYLDVSIGDYRWKTIVKLREKEEWLGLLNALCEFASLEIPKMEIFPPIDTLHTIRWFLSSCNVRIIIKARRDIAGLNLSDAEVFEAAPMMKSIKEKVSNSGLRASGLRSGGRFSLEGGLPARMMIKQFSFTGYFLDVSFARRRGYVPDVSVEKDLAEKNEEFGRLFKERDELKDSFEHHEISPEDSEVQLKKINEKISDTIDKYYIWAHAQIDNLPLPGKIEREPNSTDMATKSTEVSGENTDGFSSQLPAQTTVAIEPIRGVVDEKSDGFSSHRKETRKPTAEDSKRDRVRFAELYKKICSEKYAMSKSAQKVEQLKRAMSNPEMATIYQKYVPRNVDELLAEFTEEIENASESQDNVVSKESIEQKITSLNEERKNIIRRKRPLTRDPPRVHEIDSEIKELKQKLHSEILSPRNSLPARREAICKKYRRLFLTDLSDAMKAITSGK